MANQQVKLTDLPPAALTQLKKQLDEEIAHLTTSFQSLRSAQSRFRDCLKSLASTPSPSSSNSSTNSGQTKDVNILVPLTASLYVPGTLASSEKVLVDIGTGYFVEKNRDKAKEFYEGKVKELGGNLDELEKIVDGKGENLRMVEEVLRAKILQGQNEGDGEGKP